MEYTDCAPLARTKNDTNQSGELFEGDIVISEEMIRHYYNITDYELKTGNRFRNRTRDERGATSVSSKLWPNGIVYYTFDSSLPANLTRTIRNAMKDYERKTCLRFVKRRSRNHIKFVSENTRCWSKLGMIGGEQKLNLQYPYCNTFGIVLHEIGHAIGFWHEQSRPDRDSYVNILYSNLKLFSDHNFMKRTYIKSFGVEYDYGSIMHYGTHTFSSGRGPTIQVNNGIAYTNQGQPTLGQRTALSAKDIQQVNYLYDCPGAGITGRLRIKVRYARNLPDTDPWLNAPDPYVRITAIHSSTSTVTRDTSVKMGTQNPTWNEFLGFGVHRWKYFYVQIWDYDFLFGDDRMSELQSFAPAAIGSRQYVKHCTTPSCSGYLWLDYYLCPNGWGGNSCAHKWSNLRFYIRYGRYLKDRDGWFDSSDPYVEVIAYNTEGTSVRKTTSTLNNDLCPDWNQFLDFGAHTWKTFKIRVWDNDLIYDEGLSLQQTVSISTGVHSFISHVCYKGYIKYDYYFL